jgi:lipopolysaccharide biosynthesis glycosyltransferase
MRWFFALNAESARFGDYAMMAQVAVWSARQNTKLQPHFLYAGDDDPPLLAWMRDHGAEIWRCRSRFYEDLCELAIELNHPTARTCGGGAYLRLEIMDQLAEHGLNDSRVLYTDCDVVFQKDPEPWLRRQPCRYFACGPEFERGYTAEMNSGVMLMGVPQLRKVADEFHAFARAILRESIYTAWDQDAYRRFFRGPLPGISWPWQRGWNSLPDELNWKPYWGENPDAAIVHFHGPKPLDREWLKTAPKEHPYHLYSAGAYQAWTDRWDDLWRKIQAEDSSPSASV